MKRYRKLIIQSISAYLGFVTFTSATILSDFSLFTFGDVRISSQVEGNSFIGGDLTQSGTFATRDFATSSTNPDSVVIGGDVSGNFNINRGNVRYGGSILNGGFNMNGGGSEINDTEANVTAIIDPIGAEIVATSNFFSGLANANSSSIVANNTLTINGTGSTFSVINLESSDFTGVANIDYNLSADSGALIINVAGTDIDFNSANFIGSATQDATRSRILFNFFEAETLDVTRTIEGSVLAPGAHLTISSAINGSVAVSSAILNAEIRGPTFGRNQDDLGLPTIIPELANFSLFASMACLALAISIRRQRG
ncbi:MAG: choice-of-anchor A family protein [Verrucomicrobiota bacterium]